MKPAGKKFFKRAVIFIVTASIVCGITLTIGDSKQTTLIAGVIAAALWTMLIFFAFDGKYFHQRFWMKAYENGIDFMQIGFFPWKDTYFYYHGKNGENSMVLFRHGGLRNPNFFWPGYLEASRIGCFLEWGDEAGSSHDHAFFSLSMPSRVTNMPLDTFVRLIEPQTKVQTFDDVKAFHQSQSNQIT